jgi:two-component system, NarL family, nitrate/nitrite response regulator NarL
LGTRTKALTVYLLAPDRLLRAGLCRVLDDADISVAGAAATLDEARAEIVREAPPDLMLVDWSVGDAQRLIEIRCVRESLPQMRVVVLTDDLSIESLAQCFAAGAHGCLVKTISSAALKQSLALVALGEKVFPSNLATSIASRSSPVPTTARRGAGVAGLSEREVKILQSLATGKFNKAIADDLGITESTVKAHLKAILRKLHLRNRTQAALWAVNNGVAASSR